MDEELKLILIKLAKIISVDSDNSESEIYDELVSGFAPYLEDSKASNDRYAALKKGINYLLYTHQFPRCGASVCTYVAMVEALMDISYPIVVHNKETLDFLKIMENGIRQAYKVAKDVDSSGDT